MNKNVPRAVITTDANGVIDFLNKIRKERMNIIDKEVISYALNQTGWNRTKASKILKIISLICELINGSI